MLQEQLSLQSSIQTFIQTNIALQGDMIRQLNALAMEDPTTLLLELSSAPVGFLRPSAPLSPPPAPRPPAPVLMGSAGCESFDASMQGGYAPSQKQPHYPPLQPQEGFQPDHLHHKDPHPYTESGGQGAQFPQSPASLPLHNPIDYQHQHHFNGSSGDYMELGDHSTRAGEHTDD